MEIIRRIDELIEDRKAKMEALNIEVEKMEKDIPIKKAQLEEMKKEFSKTLTVELSDDIAELEHSINMLERKVETIKANMEYTPKIETTVEEVKQQYAAELNKLNLQYELNAISVARENYFYQLNNYKSKLMDALSLRKSIADRSLYIDEELYHEIIKAMVLEFRALKLKAIKPVSSTDKSGYNFSSTESSILNGISNYINYNQNV